MTIIAQGPAQVNHVRGIMLKHAISLWLKTGMLTTRGLGVKRMTQLAGEYTGKTYAAGCRGMERAYNDLVKYFEETPKPPASY